MTECECICGKDGYPMNAISCPVHGTWRPIETAPKDGSEILVCGPYSDAVAIVRWGNANSNRGEWVCRADGYDAVEHADDFGVSYRTFEFPSHWMEMPERPLKI